MASPDVLVERGLTRAAVEALSMHLGENELELRARLDAFELFENLSAPPWRLSGPAKRNLTTLDLERAIPFCAEGTSGERIAGELALEGDAPATCIIEVDGQVLSVRLAPEITASGAYVAPFETALRERPALVRPHLGSVVSTDTHRFTALGTALRRGGIFVHVPRGVLLSEPIELRTIVDRASVFPRVLIVAEEHAAVQVVEFIESRAATAGGTRIVCATSEIVAQRGARVHYAALQRLGEDVAEIGVRRAAVAGAATVEIVPVVLGGDLVKLDCGATLDGEGAAAKVLGCFFASGSEAFDLASRITHGAPHTTGDALVLGAANGTGRAAFNGMISILANGAGSESNLKTRSLLLSSKARVDSVPGLEIANNDVKAYHGATVGEIDQETLFFCQARGIALDDARRMIVAGFFSPVVDAIPSARAHAWLRERIEAKL